METIELDYKANKPERSHRARRKFDGEGTNRRWQHCRRGRRAVDREPRARGGSCDYGFGFGFGIGKRARHPLITV